MVATELQQLHLLAHGLQLTQQRTALIELVLSKANQQALAPVLLAADQPQGFFRSWAEFTAHSKARR